jgi:FtsK/SpoIIIE family/FtsK alpha domain
MLVAVAGLVAWLFVVRSLIRGKNWNEVVFVTGWLLFALSHSLQVPELLVLGIVFSGHYFLAGKTGTAISMLLSALTALVLLLLPAAIGQTPSYLVAGVIALFAVAVRFKDHQWIAVLAAGAFLVSVPAWQGDMVSRPAALLSGAAGLLTLPWYLWPHECQALLSATVLLPWRAITWPLATAGNALARVEFRGATPISSLDDLRMRATGSGGFALALTAGKTQRALRTFGVKGRIVKRQSGPALMVFGFRPDRGVELDKVRTRLSDVQRVARLPGGLRAAPGTRGLVNIESLRAKRQPFGLRELLTTMPLGDLVMPLGRAALGEPLYLDLGDPSTPHVLIAGTTGSGKSVGLTAMLLSLLLTNPNLRMVIVDPKLVEFGSFEGIPNVAVITDVKLAIRGLEAVVAEMTRRYQLFKSVGAKSLTQYASSTGDTSIPRVVFAVDEFASMVLTLAKKQRDEMFASMARVTAEGRAAGIHAILATQSPRADVLTGVILANCPVRLAFRVGSELESRIILDSVPTPATILGGAGDFLVQMGGKLTRGQAPLVTPEEVVRVCSALRG